MDAPVLTFGARAQAGASANPMTVDQAVERAEACNPQVHALRAAIDLAKQRKSAASDFEEPEALLAWGNLGDEFGNFVSTGNNDKESRAGGRLYVPNPFLIVPRVSARTAEVMASKADLQDTLWLVECDVRRLSAELYYLAEDMALATELAHAQSEILKDVRVRAQQGAATASDVVTAVQRQLETQNNLDLTRHRHQLVQRDLAALLDTPPTSLQIVTAALTPLFLPESTFALWPVREVALASRGDVAALHWRALAARSAYREARNVRIPWFKEITAGNREPTDQWWVGIGVTVPVFSWTKNHTEDVLQAQLNLAGVNETNGVQRVCRELRDALDELEERQRLEKRNRNEVAPLIAEMRQTLQLLKRTPNLMASQVVATEAQILEASRLELAARWQYHLALLNLERVLGKPMSEALGTLTRKL
jgi:outer membrane protein TolC